MNEVGEEGEYIDMRLSKNGERLLVRLWDSDYLGIIFVVCV